MIQETTMLKMDKPTSRHLEILAEYENRTKIDELRFLVKERANTLGVSLTQRQKKEVGV